MASPVRTTFVTVLSWAFIGIGALGAVFCLLFGLMTAALLRAAEDGSPIARSYRVMEQAVQAMPAPWPWLYAHQVVLLLVAAALMLLHLVCAIGLLKRRNVARLGFIALMLLDIVLQGLSVPYMQRMQDASQLAMKAQMPPNVPPFFETWMAHVQALQHIEVIVRPIVLTLVFGWIAWRLRSESARREFSASP